MDTQAYFQCIRRDFLENGLPDRAEKQRAYMKGHFDYFGLKAPEWTALWKAHVKRHGWLELGEPLYDFVDLCYADEHRELHYVAIETVQRQTKKCPKSYITLLEHLIVTNSWWDTVDWLAKIVGMYFKKYPEEILPTTRRWMDSEHMWLQRVCIIFQLFYREKTDTELMFGYIMEVAHSKEFFLQKAAGWALRQHTRTDPELVIAFVQANEELLSNLTKREALRLLK